MAFLQSLDDYSRAEFSQWINEWETFMVDNQNLGQDKFPFVAMMYRPQTEADEAFFDKLWDYKRSNEKWDRMVEEIDSVARAVSAIAGGCKLQQIVDPAIRWAYEDPKTCAFNCQLNCHTNSLAHLQWDSHLPLRVVGRDTFGSQMNRYTMAFLTLSSLWRALDTDSDVWDLASFEAARFGGPKETEAVKCVISRVVRRLVFQAIGPLCKSHWKLFMVRGSDEIARLYHSALRKKSRARSKGKQRATSMSGDESCYGDRSSEGSVESDRRSDDDRWGSDPFIFSDEDAEACGGSDVDGECPDEGGDRNADKAEAGESKSDKPEASESKSDEPEACSDWPLDVSELETAFACLVNDRSRHRLQEWANRLAKQDRRLRRHPNLELAFLDIFATFSAHDWVDLYHGCHQFERLDTVIQMFIDLTAADKPGVVPDWIPPSFCDAAFASPLSVNLHSRSSSASIAVPNAGQSTRSRRGHPIWWDQGCHTPIPSFPLGVRLPPLRSAEHGYQPPGSAVFSVWPWVFKRGTFRHRRSFQQAMPPA